MSGFAKESLEVNGRLAVLVQWCKRRGVWAHWETKKRRCCLKKKVSRLSIKPFSRLKSLFSAAMSFVSCFIWSVVALGVAVSWYKGAFLRLVFYILGIQSPELSPSEKLFDKETTTSFSKRRFKTYSPPVLNAWYHLVDSDEVKPGGKPLYVRALGQSFAIWRTSNGTPIVMDAYCPVKHPFFSS